MLTRYFDAASDAVQRHGGTVEKFIGDAVMAVWGTPVAHEDDAERAVRSALEIVDRVEALGARSASTCRPAPACSPARPSPCSAPSTRASSPATSSTPRRGCSRRRRRARCSSASAPTDRCPQSIACVPVEPLSLKGKPSRSPPGRRCASSARWAAPTAAPRPSRPSAAATRSCGWPRSCCTRPAARDGLACCTSRGVAGIGKSRLVWELQKYVDGLTETFFWHQGRCPSYGDGVTFWALAEMVRGRARIADTDDADTARAALAACLEQYVPDPDERRWIEPRLGHLIGLDGPSGDRDELFGAWRRFFERVAERGTTVLVFEDLHWADPGLLDFVESLLEWCRTSPIIVLTLARPELSDRRPTWGVGVRSSSTLHLDRLADTDIEAMVTGYVEGLPPDGLARLVSRAEGVPMYAVETVRMLATAGCSSRPASPTWSSVTSAASSTFPRRCTRWSRPASTACPMRSAPSCRTRRWPVTASRWPRCAPSPAATPPSWSRCCAPWCARRCSTRTSTRARPSGASTASSSR